jgi:hypothetical protein
MSAITEFYEVNNDITHYRNGIPCITDYEKYDNVGNKIDRGFSNEYHFIEHSSDWSHIYDVKSYWFTNGSCDQCENNCRINKNLTNSPYEYKIDIDKDINNKFKYTLFKKIGKWPSDRLEYQSDCDHSDNEDENLCHRKGQKPITYSEENENLDKFMRFCENNKSHISEDFFNFVKQNFNIQYK